MPECKWLSRGRILLDVQGPEVDKDRDRLTVGRPLRD